MVTTNPKTMFYASVGPLLKIFDVDVDGAQLHERGAVTLPANIQYAWPHPSRRFLYVVSSNGGPGFPATNISPMRSPSIQQGARCVSTANPRRCRPGQSMPASIAAAVIC
jgi:hypothetical protein